MKCEKARESDAAKTNLCCWAMARRNLASDKIAIITAVESSWAEQIIAFLFSFLPSILSVVPIHSGRVALSPFVSQQLSMAGYTLLNRTLPNRNLLYRNLLNHTLPNLTKPNLT